MRFPLCLLVVATAWCVPAVAQTSTPPDLVLLRSGEMARGTVMQVVPGERVVLALPDGTTRTFEAGEIRYAGPAAQAPSEAWVSEPAPAPAPAPTDGRVTLTLDGTPGVMAATSSSDAPHLRLCGMPCTTRLELGSYRFGDVVEDDFHIETDARSIAHDAQISIRYSDRGGLRVGGATIAFVTLLGGLVACIVAGVGIVSQRADTLAAGLVAAGLGLSLGFGVGIPLAALNDRLDVRIDP